MGLTGAGFLAVTVAFAVLVVAGTMALWNRWPGGRWAFVPRLLSLLLVMASGVVVAGVQVNREFGFYTSFGDLTGRVSASSAAPPGGRLTVVPPPVPPAGGGSEVVRVRLGGPASGLSREALVYLPAAYFADPRERFPVIELFHGFPGHADSWTRQMGIRGALDEAIARGRTAPVIAVATSDDDGGRDRECVDAVRGQADETYLAVDVPAAVDANLRTLGPGSWTAAGYSTGGFCAVNLAWHHPERYRAAASLSGYFEAIVDGHTGDLYRGDAAARRWNSPVWLVEHRPEQAARVPAYLVASRGDAQAYRDLRRMEAASAGRAPVTVVTLPSGGHNFRVWRTALPDLLGWLCPPGPPGGAPAPSAAPAPGA